MNFNQKKKQQNLGYIVRNYNRCIRIEKHFLLMLILYQ
jgi:hypothetical protein